MLQGQELKGNTKHLGSVSPFLNVPQIAVVTVIPPAPPFFFLRALTVLLPNLYLEKTATSQIKLHRGFLAPESDRGNSTNPTNQSPQP